MVEQKMEENFKEEEACDCDGQRYDEEVLAVGPESFPADIGVVFVGEGEGPRIRIGSRSCCGSQ